jgi:hypothetical protein
MKRLVILLALTFTFCLMFSQSKNSKKIIVETRAFQIVKWPSNMGLIDALKNDSLSYPFRIVGNNSYILDIENEKITLKYADTSYVFNILSYYRDDDNYYFDIEGEIETH